jgi:hypothetical protein
MKRIKEIDYTNSDTLELNNGKHQTAPKLNDQEKKIIKDDVEKLIKILNMMNKDIGTPFENQRESTYLLYMAACQMLDFIEQKVYPGVFKKVLNEMDGLPFYFEKKYDMLLKFSRFSNYLNLMDLYVMNEYKLKKMVKKNLLDRKVMKQNLYEKLMDFYESYKEANSKLKHVLESSSEKSPQKQIAEELQSWKNVLVFSDQLMQEYKTSWRIQAVQSNGVDIDYSEALQNLMPA